MAGLKTKRTSASVTEFLREVDDKQKLADCRAIAKMMRTATGKRAKMWGASIVGFDSYDYVYKTGNSGTWPITGFSPRAQNISIYIMPGFSGFKSMLSQLGKYKPGKSCLYIKRLDDVDEKVLQKLINESVKEMRRRYKNS
jgi:hypothetical protein